MYELTVRAHFSSAHRLREYDGNCERLHGHNWAVDVVVAADALDELGMVCDFRVVKGVIADVVDQFDHRLLNDVPPFDAINPTTEHIARHLYGEIAKRLPEGVRPVRVTAWESEGSGATYHE